MIFSFMDGGYQAPEKSESLIMSVTLGCARHAAHLPVAHGGEGADALVTVTTIPAVALGGCA